MSEVRQTKIYSSHFTACCVCLCVTNVEVPPRRNFRTILPRVLARARRLFSG